MFKKKKTLWLLITMLILSFTLAACGGGDGGSETGDSPAADVDAEGKTTLVIAQGADAPTLDPHGTNDQPASRVSKQIYNTLVFATEEMELVPALAESWEAIDPLTWEFKLAEGVKFHNGEELKASDVKFTFERMLAEEQVAHILGPVVEIEAVDDYTVRIITYAVDVQEIIDVVLEGAGEIANGPLTDAIFGANTDLQGYEYNPEKAKELLAEAGFEDGFETTIWTNDSPVREMIATIVQAQLKEVGIDARTETVEWSRYLEDTAAGEHDMFILGWTTVTGDADYGLYALYHSSQQGSAGNRTFYSNPKVDELLDIGKTEPDQGKREEAYKEAQEIIVEEAPQLFLYFTTDNVGMQNNIEGFKLHPAGHHSIYNVSFK